MLTKILKEIQERLSEVTGNAGCNDWECPYTPENWEFLGKVAAMGVRERWWDKDCKPTVSRDGKRIQWMDFCVYDFAMEMAQERLTEFELG